MRHLAIPFAVLTVSTVPAAAVTGPVTFSGTVTATCNLVVTAPGVMTPSADLRTLSSKHSGAAPGMVTVTTTGNVNIKVDPNPTMAIPAADTTSTTWKPSYSMTGVQTIANTENATAITVPGTGTVSVHLEGTKGATDSFLPGNYAGTVTLRCEP